MALPVIPIALAAGTFMLARNITISPVDQRVDDRLDEVVEGFSVHRNRWYNQINSAARYRRVVRFGQNGPGFEIDVSALARVRLVRIKRGAVK